MKSTLHILHLEDDWLDAELVRDMLADNGIVADIKLVDQESEYVAQPFFTTKPEGRGTGLGLAICRRIIEQHGGTIDIGSELSKGTTVRITLPATSNGAVGHLL